MTNEEMLKQIFGRKVVYNALMHYYKNNLTNDNQEIQELFRALNKAGQLYSNNSR